MGKKSNNEHQEEESTSLGSMDVLEAYIEASEMYLEALKLSNTPGTDSAYIVGMTAVYFGKAFVAFSYTENLDAIKGSLHETICAYTVASTFCETNGIGKQFVYASRLITELLRTEFSEFHSH